MNTSVVLGKLSFVDMARVAEVGAGGQYMLLSSERQYSEPRQTREVETHSFIVSVRISKESKNLCYILQDGGGFMLEIGVLYNDQGLENKVKATLKKFRGLQEDTTNHLGRL